MKNIYKLLTILFLTISFNGFSQSSPGDIAFTGYNADGNDNMSFVTLIDISPAGVIFFADEEVNSSGEFKGFTGEAFLKWENTTSSVIAAGTSIVIDNLYKETLTASAGTITQVGSNRMNFAGAGDGVFAYITSTGEYNTGTNTFLALMAGASGKSFDGITDDDINSATGLTWGTNAINISGGSGSPDGGKHDRATTSGTKNELLTIINNSSNWTTSTSDGTAVLPLSGDAYTVSSASNPTSIQLTSTSATVGEGDGSTTITVSITNPSSASATTVDLVLTSGTASDIGDYTTQSLSFAAGSSTSKEVTITITDDPAVESSEDFEFKLQNVAGGESATIGSASTFKLTITDNDVAVAASDFTNAGGDKLWSNAANWSAGIPNQATSKVTVKAAALILDANAEIGQIKLAGGFGDATVTSNNSSTLTITGNGVTQPIQNNGGNVDFNLNLKVVLASSDAIETFQASAAGTCSITFGSSSDLTLNVNTKFVAQQNRSININGILRGAGQFQAGAASKINFGSTSDNSAFTGGFKMLGNNGVLTSNTADDGTFLPSGQLIQPDGSSTGHSITVNGANTFKGNIKVLGNDITLNINKNQSSAGLITLGAGNLKLSLNAAVTKLAFADNSSSTWGAGEIVVTGFQNNVISFGTSASGLTSAQLSKINIGSSNAVINASGEISSDSFVEVTASDFTNAGGDKLWSNAANWSAGIPNVSTSKVTVKTTSLIVDTNVEVGQIKLAGGFGDATVTSSNSSTLTISGKGVTQPIQNNGQNVDFNLNLKVILSSSDAIETFQASGGGTCSITFGSSSDLTLNVPTKFLAQSNRSINMNGVLNGTGQFQMGAASKINFGNTSNNSAFTGGFKMLGNNGVLVSNTADDGTFLPADVLIVPDASSTGHSITINGANTYKGNIQILGNELALNINKNQSSAGLITLGISNLNLTLDAAVTQLAFADNSSSTWSTGEIVITGFKDNVISFGTDANGLTAEQLAKINIGGTAVVINASGQIAAEEPPAKDLMIVGISDPDGGTEASITTTYKARAVEFYVINDIADLSKYGIGTANNGGGSDGVEYTFPAVSVSKGTYILVGRDSTEFKDYYGIDYDYNGGSSAIGFNGDDGFELFYNGTQIDVFGDINVDGSGQYWDYIDGWAYRKNGASPTTTFDTAGWTYSGANANDDFATNAASSNPYPIKTYKNYKQDMMILGIVDPDGGDEPGGSGSTNYSARAVELYVINDIADLSKYGIGTANNGGGSDGVEYTFPSGTASAGTFILVGRDSTQFKNYYGVNYDYNGGSSAIGYNGDDGFELFYNETQIDVYGDPNTDGTGQDWEYLDGWVHRKNGKTLSTTFNNNDWTNSGINATDDFYSNALTSNPYPLATYSGEASPTSVFLSTNEGSISEDGGSFNVTVQISDPSADSATVVQLVYTGTDSTDIGNFISETITFPAGSSTSQNASIPIYNDTDAEGEETFSFELQNISGGYQSSIGSPSIFTLTINDDDLAEFNFVYNELHIDPASDITGDANGDGTRDAIQDEFIELVNTGSSSFDLSGYYLTDETSPDLAARHIFPSGSIVDAGMPIVIFGGGVPNSPTNFGGAIVHTASENNGGVALGNSGKTIYIKNAEGLTVLSHTYTANQGSANQSVTRNPDLTGDFVSHSGVASANGALYSPGMKLDSTLLYTHAETKVQFQVMRGSYKEGEDAFLFVGVTINGASTTNATEVTIGLTGGTGTSDDIDGFSSQNLTFAAGSTTTQVATINITNDDLEEGNETFEFEITSHSGGDNASVLSPNKFTLTLSDDDISNPLILNEVLTDPPSDDANTSEVEGDANGDGTRSASQDEFVELVNSNTTQLDISGYTIFDGTGLRHTFAEGSVLDGGKAAVVFGGGSPTGDFGGSIVSTATGGSLSLNNAGDKVIINDKEGNNIIEFEWGGSTIYDGGSDQSLTRDPDLTGDFTLHTTTSSGGTYSPGTQSDGSNFDVGINDPTSVQFALADYTLANNDGSYNTGDYGISIEISNASPLVATQVEVVFTASDLGSAADIGDYTGEIITFSSGLSDAQTSTVSISSSNIELGTKYDFALQNVSGGNQATLGSNTTFTLTIGDPGSVPLGVENKRFDDIILSPNPTSDVLKVSIGKNRILERFIITDISGASIMNKSFGKQVNNLEIDVKPFDNGLYILNLEFSDDSAKLKFIRE